MRTRARIWQNEQENRKKESFEEKNEVLLLNLEICLLYFVVFCCCVMCVYILKLLFICSLSLFQLYIYANTHSISFSMQFICYFEMYYILRLFLLAPTIDCSLFIFIHWKIGQCAQKWDKFKRDKWARVYMCKCCGMISSSIFMLPTKHFNIHK